MCKNASKLLLNRYRKGDSRAAAEIYSRYAKRLIGLARSRLVELLQAKVDPEDVAQETFLAFFELADQDKVRWDQEGDLWRLLAAIAVNQVNRQVEHFNAAKRRVSNEQVVLAEPPTSESSDSFAVLELNDLVEEALREAKPLAKRILSARLAGLNLAEIADLTGRSQRTIRRIIQSIKAKLVRSLEPESMLEMDFLNPTEIEFVVPNLNANHEHYDLLRMVGIGAFGKVYLAQDNRTGSCVAVKVLRKSWIGDLRAEQVFLNEASILSKISHPNIIKCHDVGPLPNGSWFLVMEFADGPSLDQVLSNQLQSRVVFAWLVETAMAIDFLHRNNVVHGDLNPTNIVICDGHARLVDFGFSVNRSEPKRSTQNSNLVGGTAGFLAPELQTSFAADVYSFGKIVEIVLRSSSIRDHSTTAKLRELAIRATDSQWERRPSAVVMLDELESLRPCLDATEATSEFSSS